MVVRVANGHGRQGGYGCQCGHGCQDGPSACSFFQSSNVTVTQSPSDQG